MTELPYEVQSELMFPAAMNHVTTQSSTHPFQSDRWGINNSSLGDYSWSIFGEDDQDRLAEFIGATIGDGDHTAIDIAGGTDGRAMQEMLDLGLVRTGLVTNLLDRRNQEARDFPGLHHVAGDIVLRATWEAIDSWCDEYAPDGVSVILHRPVGGIQHLDPCFYELAAHKLLDMLCPGGVMVAQVPNILAPYPWLSSPELSRIGEAISTRGDVDAEVKVGDGRKYAFLTKHSLL